MPIGILTDEQLEKELNGGKNQPHQDNPSRAEVIDQTSVGRPAERPNIPDVVKKVVAEERLNGASLERLSALFNVSAPTIRSASNGMTSAAPDAEVNESLTNHVKEIKSRIIQKSSKKLLIALSEITKDKLSEASARDNASIAKDMSNIIRNMEDRHDGGKSPNQANFVFYAPQQKSIETYDVVSVRD